MHKEVADLLPFLRRQAQVQSANIADEQFILTSVMKIYAHFRPHNQDMPYSDIIIVAQTQGGVGSCYCYCDDPVLSVDILGMDARMTQTGNRCLDIAILDATYGNLQPEPAMCFFLKGNTSQKAEARATLILSEIRRLMQENNLEKPSITMVGAVGNLLSGLVSVQGRVTATDFDNTLIGRKLAGVLVEDGSMTLQRIRESQIALITGMTLTTNTLKDILGAAKTNNVRVIIYAQTGGNLAGEFLKLGVNCVISEEYPFYMFPGITKLRVFRANRL